jgi:hypothetical protein
VDAVPPGVNALAEIFRFLAISMRYPSLELFNRDYLAALRSLLEGVGRNDEIGRLDKLISD